MRIESNLKGVIRSLRRFEAEVPVAMDRALDPGRWREPLRRRAEQTLRRIAEQGEERYIPMFMASFALRGLQIGFEAMLSGPRLAQDATATALAAAERAKRPGRPGRSDFEVFVGGEPIRVRTTDEAAAVERVNRAIDDWVREEKRQDFKESIYPGKTDEEIANNIKFILFFQNPAVTQTSDSGGSQLAHARKSLAGAIQDFIERQDKSPFAPDPMPPITIQIWLFDVLQEWVAFVRSDMMPTVHQEIRKAWRRAHTELGV